jgi:hypothetical protein
LTIIHVEHRDLGQVLAIDLIGKALDDRGQRLLDLAFPGCWFRETHRGDSHATQGPDPGFRCYRTPIGMFGSRGNLPARSLLGILGYLQKQGGVVLHVAPELR